MAKPPRLSMIGLVRELTRASLFAAFRKPSIASPCRSRMKFSRVNALTMRMPCAVSCIDSIICAAPWNSLAMILRTRMPILRTPNTASRNQHQRQERKQRILRHHDDDEPDDRQCVARKCGDQKVEHGARRLGDEGLTGDEHGRMRLAVIAHLHPQHLVEHALLDVGDNTVADLRHHNLLSVGRKALHCVNDDNRRRDFPHRRKAAADENLVDDLADNPGGKRGRKRDEGHHRKREGVALPVLEALVGQQPTQDRVRGRIEKGADALAGFTPNRQCFSPSPRLMAEPYS